MVCAHIAAVITISGASVKVAAEKKNSQIYKKTANETQSFAVFVIFYLTNSPT